MGLEWQQFEEHRHSGRTDARSAQLVRRDDSAGTLQCHTCPLLYRYVKFLFFKYFRECRLKKNFCLLGDDRNIRLLETSYNRVMALLQSHHDITFLAAVRQERLNVGTLFSVSEGFTR